MAEDRLPAWCAPSTDAISAATLTFRDCAISLSAFQNASSRLTLVRWPAIRIERLITGDCIGGPQYPPSLRGAQRATKQSRILNIRILDCLAFARNDALTAPAASCAPAAPGGRTPSLRRQGAGSIAAPHR